MSLNKHLSNIVGKKSSKKYIVFEVDDYGEKNLNDTKVLSNLKLRGINPTYFVEHDRPGSIEDLSNLFEILSSFMDENGRNVVFSPQIVTANPDFQAIRDAGFQKYYYKDFVQGLIDYQGVPLWDLWKIGMDKKIWHPELHGREHLNVRLWMSALQNEDSLTRKAFDENVYGIFDKNKEVSGMKITEAFNIQPSEDLQPKLEILKDSLRIFKEKIGYIPTLFTPPASKYFSEMEQVLVEEGVKCISVSRFHNYPDGKGNYKTAFRYPGKRSSNGILYSVRNCLFEPHSKNRVDWVSSCLSDIAVAFKWNKPAIISSHRINFVQSANSEKGNGLKKLEQLLEAIQKNWPDAQFISSRELYHQW